LAACDPFERVLFEFFWMTGFRDAEVQHVTRADLDLKEQVVRVTEKPQWGFIPKNWEQREVPIPDRLSAVCALIQLSPTLYAPRYAPSAHEIIQTFPAMRSKDAPI
jgi:integrase